MHMLCFPISKRFAKLEQHALVALDLIMVFRKLMSLHVVADKGSQIVRNLAACELDLDIKKAAGHFCAACPPFTWDRHATVEYVFMAEKAKDFEPDIFIEL